MKRYVNLREVTVKEPLKVDTEFGKSVLALPEDEISDTTPFKLHIEIKKRLSGYHFAGKIEGAVTLKCSRCNKEYREEIKEKFEFDLMPTSEITEGRIKSGELDIKFSDEDVVDLSEVVREQIFLNIPFKPLCDELCSGLALEEKEKSTEIRDMDTRWEKLKFLKEKLNREEK